MCGGSFDIVLNKLKCQFLCCYPLHCINWQELPADITWEQQAQLISGTYKHSINQQFPIKIAYQLNFVKHLLDLLEKANVEVHDVIYESYCELQQRIVLDTTQQYAYKHYMLTAYNSQLTLRESKSFVAAGTTGLCSWQASLALADYLLYNAELINHKQVLELGSGTGLCGFVLAKCCTPKHVLLTDGSLACVELIDENIKRNFSEAQLTSNEHCYAIGSTLLQACHVEWHDVAKISINENGILPDVLLAADVVYDDSVFADLVYAIDFVFTSRRNCLKMLLAATVRNETTLNTFLQMLASKNFAFREENVIPVEESNLYWDRTTPVKIFLITRWL